MKLKRSQNNAMLRTIALAVCSTFLLQDAALAAPEMAALLGSPAPLGVSRPAAPVRLPESAAMVEEYYPGSGSGRMIYLIQDAHTNPSGQLHIAQTLEVLNAQTPFNQVFLEAGTGDDSLAFLSELADRSTRKEVALPYVRKGLLQGAEYFNLTSGDTAVLWGVEDPSLYGQALERYRAVVQGRQIHREYLQRLESAVKLLKEKIYNSALTDLDRLVRMEAEGSHSFADTLEALKPLMLRAGVTWEKYPSLLDIRKLSRTEKKLDFKKVQEEEQTALGLLDPAARASVEESRARIGKLAGADFSAQSAYAAFFQETLASAGVTESRFSELFEYFGYIRSCEQIRSDRVIREKESLMHELYARLAASEDEARLVRAARAVEALEKLASLELTPDRYQAEEGNGYFTDSAALEGFLNAQWMRLGTGHEKVIFLNPEFDRWIAQARHFYRLTLERDKKMVAEALARMDASGEERAAFVAGGYHAPSLKALLKASGVAYVSILPQIAHPTDKAKYERLLLAQHPDTSSGAIRVASRAAPAQALSLRPSLEENPRMLEEIARQLGAGRPEALGRALERIGQGARLADKGTAGPFAKKIPYIRPDKTRYTAEFAAAVKEGSESDGDYYLFYGIEGLNTGSLWTFKKAGLRPLEGNPGFSTVFASIEAYQEHRAAYEGTFVFIPKGQNPQTPNQERQGWIWQSEFGKNGRVTLNLSTNRIHRQADQISRTLIPALRQDRPAANRELLEFRNISYLISAVDQISTIAFDEREPLAVRTRAFIFLTDLFDEKDNYFDLPADWFARAGSELMGGRWRLMPGEIQSGRDPRVLSDYFLKRAEQVHQKALDSDLVRQLKPRFTDAASRGLDLRKDTHDQGYGRITVVHGNAADAAYRTPSGHDQYNINAAVRFVDANGGDVPGFDVRIRRFPVQPGQQSEIVADYIFYDFHRGQGVPASAVPAGSKPNQNRQTIPITLKGKNLSFEKQCLLEALRLLSELTGRSVAELVGREQVLDAEMASYLPEGTGLGGSVTLASQIFKRLMESVGLPADLATNEELALAGAVIEGRLGGMGGFQDGYSGSGLRILKIPADGKLLDLRNLTRTASDLAKAETEFLDILDSYGILFLTRPHRSGRVLGQLIKEYFRREPGYMERLNGTAQTSKNLVDLLRRRAATGQPLNVDDIAPFFNQQTRDFETITPGFVTPEMRAIIDYLTRKDLIAGAQPMGAGFGGFLFLLLKRPEDRTKVESILNNHYGPLLTRKYAQSDILTPASRTYDFKTVRPEAPPAMSAARLAKARGSAISLKGLSPQEELDRLLAHEREVQKESYAPGTGKFVRAYLFSDTHGAISKMDEMILKGFQATFPGAFSGITALNPDKSLQEQIGAIVESLGGWEKVRDQIAFVNGGDLMDRQDIKKGESGLAVFNRTMEMLDLGILDFTSGNHDQLVIMPLMGIHLPTYEGYRFYLKDTDEERAAQLDLERQIYADPSRPDGRARLKPIEQVVSEKNRDKRLFPDENARLRFWMTKFAEYYRDRTDVTSPLVQQWMAIGREVLGDGTPGSQPLLTKEQVKTLTGEQKMFWNKFTGKNMEDVDIYTGVRTIQVKNAAGEEQSICSVGLMSAVWWRILKQNFELQLEKIDDPVIRAAWSKAIDYINQILPGLEQDLRRRRAQGEWWVRAIEALYAQNYYTAEWAAWDWLVHPGWGPALFEEINRKNAAAHSDEPPVTLDNFLMNKDIQRIRDGMQANISLYEKNLYVTGLHANLPMDRHQDEKTWSAGQPPVIPGQYRFRYNGKGYASKGYPELGVESIWSGMDELESAIRSASPKNLAAAAEAFNAIYDWYADFTTRSKPKDVLEHLVNDPKAYEEFFRINGIFGLQATGHNPLPTGYAKYPKEKLGAFKGIYTPGAGAPHKHGLLGTDLGAARKFGNQGGYIVIYPGDPSGGMRFFGYRPGSKVLEENPPIFYEKAYAADPSAEPVFTVEAVSHDDYLRGNHGAVNDRIRELEHLPGIHGARLAVSQQAMLEEAKEDVRKAARIINLDPQILEKILTPERVLEAHFDVVMDDGTVQRVYGRRTLYNGALGAGKGGIRFDGLTEKMKKDGMTQAEFEKESAAEADMLALKMIWKFPLLEVPFGGAKGVVATPNDIRNYSNAEYSRIMRGYVRAMVEAAGGIHAFGPYIDVPAPDLNTSVEVNEDEKNNLMAVFLDEYLNILEEQGVVKLEGAASSTDPTVTPKTDRYLDWARQNPDEAAEWLGTVTGKANKGGSLGRKEATGQGVYFTILEMLKSLPDGTLEALGWTRNLEDKTVTIQGNGNVGSETARALAGKGILEKRRAKIVGQSDFWGMVRNDNGLDVDAVGEFHAYMINMKNMTDLYFKNRQKGLPIDAESIAKQLKLDADAAKKFNAYLKHMQPAIDANATRDAFDNASIAGLFEWKDGTVYDADADAIFDVPSDIFVPAFRENQISHVLAEKDKGRLDKNGDPVLATAYRVAKSKKMVVEAANSPTTTEAERILGAAGVSVIPDILTNAGGATVSYFEWLQNIENERWLAVTVEQLLSEMIRIATWQVIQVAAEKNVSHRIAANIIALKRVVNAEIARNPAWVEKYSSTDPGKALPYEGYDDTARPETLEEWRLFDKRNAFNQGRLIKQLIRRENKFFKDKVDAVVKEIKRLKQRGERNVRWVFVGGPSSTYKTYIAEMIVAALKAEGYDAEYVYASAVKDPIAVWPERPKSDERIIVAEGSEVFRPANTDEKMGAIPAGERYGVFVDIAPSMKLEGNVPMSSAEMRLMFELLYRSLPSQILQRGPRSNPLNTLFKWREDRRHNILDIQSRRPVADTFINSYLGYELPLIKRAVLLELAQVEQEADAAFIQNQITEAELNYVQGVVKQLETYLAAVPAIDPRGLVMADSPLSQYFPPAAARLAGKKASAGPQESKGAFSALQVRNLFSRVQPIVTQSSIYENFSTASELNALKSWYWHMTHTTRGSSKEPDFADEAGRIEAAKFEKIQTAAKAIEERRALRQGGVRLFQTSTRAERWFVHASLGKLKAADSFPDGKIITEFIKKVIGSDGQVKAAVKTAFERSVELSENDELKKIFVDQRHLKQDLIDSVYTAVEEYARSHRAKGARLAAKDLSAVETADVDAAVRYMSGSDELPEHADVLLIPGHANLPAIIAAAEIAKRVDTVVVSGGIGRLTPHLRDAVRRSDYAKSIQGDLDQMTEAEIIRDVLVALGVTQEIVLEKKARNTTNNFVKTRQLFEDLDRPLRSMIYMPDPLQVARTRGVFREIFYGDRARDPRYQPASDEVVGYGYAAPESLPVLTSASKETLLQTMDTVLAEWRKIQFYPDRRWMAPVVIEEGDRIIFDRLRRARTSRLFAAWRSEAGLHTTTGGLGHKDVPDAVYSELIKILSGRQFIVAVDRPEVLLERRVDDALAPYALFIRNQAEQGDLAEAKGADAVFAVESLSAEVIRVIRERNPGLMIFTQIDIEGKSQEQITNEVRSAQRAGADGAIMKRYRAAGKPLIDPQVFAALALENPDFILMPAGGVFEGAAVEVFNLPDNVTGAFGFSAQNPLDMEAQAARYEEYRTQVLGPVAARLAADGRSRSADVIERVRVRRIKILNLLQAAEPKGLKGRAIVEALATEFPEYVNETVADPEARRTTKAGKPILPKLSRRLTALLQSDMEFLAGRELAFWNGRNYELTRNAVGKDFNELLPTRIAVQAKAPDSSQSVGRTYLDRRKTTGRVIRNSTLGARLAANQGLLDFISALTDLQDEAEEWAESRPDAAIQKGRAERVLLDVVKVEVNAAFAGVAQNLKRNAPVDQRILDRIALRTDELRRLLKLFKPQADTDPAATAIIGKYREMLRTYDRQFKKHLEATVTAEDFVDQESARDDFTDDDDEESSNGSTEADASVDAPEAPSNLPPVLIQSSTGRRLEAVRKAVAKVLQDRPEQFQALQADTLQTQRAEEAGSTEGGIRILIRSQDPDKKGKGDTSVEAGPQIRRLAELISDGVRPIFRKYRVTENGFYSLGKLPLRGKEGQTGSSFRGLVYQIRLEPVQPAGARLSFTALWSRFTAAVTGLFGRPASEPVADSTAGSAEIDLRNIGTLELIFDNQFKFLDSTFSTYKTPGDLIVRSGLSRSSRGSQIMVVRVRIDEAGLIRELPLVTLPKDIKLPDLPFREPLPKDAVTLVLTPDGRFGLPSRTEWPAWVPQHTIAAIETYNNLHGPRNDQKLKNLYDTYAELLEKKLKGARLATGDIGSSVRPRADQGIFSGLWNLRNRLGTAARRLWTHQPERHYRASLVIPAGRPLPIFDTAARASREALFAAPVDPVDLFPVSRHYLTSNQIPKRLRSAAKKAEFDRFMVRVFQDQPEAFKNGARLAINLSGDDPSILQSRYIAEKDELQIYVIASGEQEVLLNTVQNPRKLRSEDGEKWDLTASDVQMAITALNSKIDELAAVKSDAPAAIKHRVIHLDLSFWWDAAHPRNFDAVLPLLIQEAKNARQEYPDTAAIMLAGPENLIARVQAAASDAGANQLFYSRVKDLPAVFRRPDTLQVDVQNAQTARKVASGRRTFAVQALKQTDGKVGIPAVRAILRLALFAADVDPDADTESFERFRTLVRTLTGQEVSAAEALELLTGQAEPELLKRLSVRAILFVPIDRFLQFMRLAEHMAAASA